MTERVDLIVQIRKRSGGKLDLRSASNNTNIFFSFFETEKLAWFAYEWFFFILFGIIIIIFRYSVFTAKEFDKQLFSFSIVTSLVLGIPEEVFSLLLKL